MHKLYTKSKSILRLYKLKLPGKDLDRECSVTEVREHYYNLYEFFADHPSINPPKKLDMKQHCIKLGAPGSRKIVYFVSPEELLKKVLGVENGEEVPYMQGRCMNIIYESGVPRSIEAGDTSKLEEFFMKNRESVVRWKSKEGGGDICSKEIDWLSTRYKSYPPIWDERTACDEKAYLERLLALPMDKISIRNLFKYHPNHTAPLRRFLINKRKCNKVDVDEIIKGIGNEIHDFD